MSNDDLIHHEINVKREEKPKKKKEEVGQNKFSKFYEANYKKLLIIPLILIVASVLILGINFAATGELFHRDITLKGGVSVTLIPQDTIDIDLLEEALSDYPDVLVREIKSRGIQEAVLVEAGIDISQVDAMVSIIEQTANPQDISVRSIGASLGQSFFTQAIQAILFAFLLMSIVVFIYFRSAVPAFFVVWTAFIDMIGTLAVLVLIGEEVSSAGLAAFLLLIGYSVDTDILLTSRVLKGKEDKIHDRITGAFKTGITLTATALAAITIGYLMGSEGTLKQIMLVLMIGLSLDVIHTWLTNAGLLRWYMERKYDK